MIRFADTTSQHLAWYAVVKGLSESQAGYPKSVREYLSERKAVKKLKEQLLPKCLDAAKQVMPEIMWFDECLIKHVITMIEGADITVLQNFWSRYRKTKNRRVLFLNFVINEL